MKLLFTTIIGLILLAVVVYAPVEALNFDIIFPTEADPVYVSGSENITLRMIIINDTLPKVENINVTSMIVNDSNICLKSDTSPIYSVDTEAVWHLDNKTGYDDMITAYEESNTHNGTIQQGIAGIGWTTDGKIGSAFEFDGTDDLINITNVTGLELREFTIEVWARKKGAGTGGGQAVISKDLFGGFFIGNYYVSAFNQVWRFCIFEMPITGWVCWNSPDQTIDNQWYFLTISYSDRTRLMKSYINGTLQDTSAVNSITYVGTEIKLGEYDSATGYDYFQGTIDEVSYYKRVLTDVEILDHYNSRRYNASDMYWYQNCTTPSGLFGSHNISVQIQNMADGQYISDSEHNAVIYPTLEEMKYVSELLIIVFVVLVFVAVKFS